jgi:hypothetical protein
MDPSQTARFRVKGSRSWKAVLKSLPIIRTKIVPFTEAIDSELLT